MPATKRIHKLDTRELEDDLALARVSEDKDTEKAIVSFCELYSIPLRAERVKELSLRYQALANKLNKQHNTPKK
jgi:hypothetical protein